MKSTSNGAERVWLGEATHPSDSGFIWSARNGSSDTLDFGYAYITGNSEPSVANFFLNYNNQWIHIVIICDYTNKTLKFYRNGVQFGATQNLTGTPLFPSTNRVKYIGAYATSGYNIVDGSLDEVRIYNRGLSAEEIATIYNQTKGKY
jgi:hypothetical protein